MSKYTNLQSVIQVIGGIYKNPQLLDNDNYFFYEEDFTEEFHKILFGAMYNLHTLGAKEININAIEDYLQQRPKAFGIYKTNKGAEYLQKISETIQLSTFDYYYQKMKKMTLMRMYEKSGMNLDWLYDPDNILDIKKKEAQENWLDNTSLESIAKAIDDKIDRIKDKYLNDSNRELVDAATGIDVLLENLKKNPEVGLPLYGKYINTVTRGARLGKFYLRSAATRSGKIS